MQHIKEWKEDNLITPADCIAYGKSEHVQGSISLIEDIGEGNVLPTEVKKSQISIYINYIFDLSYYINPIS